MFFQTSILFFFSVNINACEQREKKGEGERKAGRAREAREDNNHEGAIVHWSETKAEHQHRGEVRSWS